MSKKNNQQNYETYEDEESSLGATVKGIIAIMITLLAVVIIVMVFAKSLLISQPNTNVKTGTITSTEYIPPVTTTTTTAEETVKVSSKRTTTQEEELDPQEEENAQTIKCISAVYLHPQPTSSSENLLTIPNGAECIFYRNENGWYYVEYNGTKGYAWQTFFETPSGL